MENNKIMRQEYPRPDFQRGEWLNLNGEWDFEFDDKNQGEVDRWYENSSFTKKITVPFCYQSKLSGINSQELHENLWYKKIFELPESFSNKRVFLNFGAVDYITKVWINGEYIGLHKGGNISFKLEATRYLKKGENIIVIKVEDKYECVQPRGKQYWLIKPDRCWYTATSGIWQTVWLDTSGELAIEKLRMTPDIDKRNLLVEIYLDNIAPNTEADIEILFKQEKVKHIKTELMDRITRLTIDIREYDYIDEIHYWSPENPNLYDINIVITKDGLRTDLIKSYFGMRKVSIKDDIILLNNKPYYQKLVLDQGYWPDSLLTPPSDEAIIYDIEMTKKFGFNGARKHQKIEDPRYYYWADKLGLLVWGEMPSAYHYNAEEVENITREWVEFINRDYNHPSIVTWVPLNESWGVRNIVCDKEQQSFAAGLYYLTRSLDGTRFISTNDGWELVEQSDVCSIHDYAPWGENITSRYLDKDTILNNSAQGRMTFCKGHKYNGQPIILSEYGGIAFKSDSKENWGYFGAVDNKEDFLKRYSSVTKALKDIPYIRGYCYTQLTDVMQEVNGLMTADRKAKLDVEEINKINR